MTSKRDLKKRVRERQARTGERYTAARQQVLSKRARPSLTVVELRDLSAEAARLGFRCKVGIYPELAARLDTRALLARIRDALRATDQDPVMEPLRAAVLGGPTAQVRERSIPLLLAGTYQAYSAEGFVARAAAGIGGVSEGGTMLALPAAGRRGIEMVVCLVKPDPMPSLARRDPTLILTTPADLVIELDDLRRAR